MYKFNFTYCSVCNERTVFIKTPNYDWGCMRHNKRFKDELEKFDAEREHWRKWLAGLDFIELNEVSNDLAKRLDYVAERMERGQDRQSFLNIMSSEFGGRGAS